MNFFQPNASSKERGGIERFGINSTDETDRNHLRLHMPISPIAQSNNLLNEENRSSEATIGSDGEGEEWHEPKSHEQNELERAKQNEPLERVKLGEDLFDCVGDDESIPALVEDEVDESSVEPELESCELYQVENQGDDESDATESRDGGASGEASTTSGFVFVNDKADSEPRERGMEDKRVFSGEVDYVDLVMIFDHEERDVASSDAISNEVTDDVGLEYNGEIDEIKIKRKGNDTPSPESQGSEDSDDAERLLNVNHENSSEDVTVNVPANEYAFEGEDSNLRTKREGELEGERDENRSVCADVVIDDDVETNIDIKDINLSIPPVEDLRGEGDGDECPIDNFSKVSSVSHDPSRRRCECTEKESEGSGRKRSAEPIENDDLLTKSGDDVGGRVKNWSAADELDDDVEKDILIKVCEKEAMEREDKDIDESLLRCNRNDSDGASDFSIPASISETEKNEIEICCVDERSRKDTDGYANVNAPYSFKRKGELVSLLSPSSPTNKNNPLVSPVESPRSVVDDDECRLSSEVSSRSKQSSPRPIESSEYTKRERSLGAETKRKANLGANDEVLALRDSPPSSNSQVKGSMVFTGVRGRSVSCHAKYDCNLRFFRSEPPPSDEQTINNMQHLDHSVSPVEFQGEDGCSKEESLTLIPTMNAAYLGATMTRPCEASQGTQEQKAPIVTLPVHEQCKGGASKRGAQMTTPPTQYDDEVGASKPGASKVTQPGQQVKRGAPMMASSRYDPFKNDLLIDALWEHVLNERGLKMKKLVERIEIELVFCQKVLNSADFLTQSIQENSLLMFRDLIKGGIKSETKHHGSLPKERVGDHLQGDPVYWQIPSRQT